MNRLPIMWRLELQTLQMLGCFLLRQRWFGWLFGRHDAAIESV